MFTFKNRQGAYEVWLKSCEPQIETILPYLTKIDSLYFVPHYSWDVIGDLLVALDKYYYEEIEIELEGCLLFISDYYDISGIIKLIEEKRISGVQFTIKYK